MNGKEEGEVKVKKKKGSLVKPKKYKDKKEKDNDDKKDKPDKYDKHHGHVPSSTSVSDDQAIRDRDRGSDRDKDRDRDGSDGPNPHPNPSPLAVASENVKDRENKDTEQQRKRNPFLPSLGGGKKKELNNKKTTPDIFTLWLTIGNFDPVTFEVDSSITIHEMKKLITDEEEFELQGLKLHKFKCYTESDVPLNPRQTIEEQLQDGDAVILKPVHNGLNTASSTVTIPGVPPKTSEQLMLLVTQELGSIKKQISHLTSQGKEKFSERPVDRTVKKNIESLAERLDGIDDTLIKNHEALDEAMKQLAILTDTFKRVGGIPAVQNELMPDQGGIPGGKSKDIIGHDGPVWTLFHGKELLFSGSSDTTIKAWDVNTSRLKYTLRGHTSIVHCVAGYNDDKTLVSGSDDKTIKIWDVENQTCKKTIRDDNIACVLRTHRGHIFSGSFKCVKVWNMDRFQLVEILPGHNHWVRAINLANGYCFSGGHNIIKVWDLASFKCSQTLNESCGSIYSLAVHGNMLLAGTYENTVNIWDLRSHKYVRSLPGHAGAVYSIALHGNKLFSGSYDTSIRVWDLTTFKCIQRLVGHTSSVEALTTGKDKLFSASTDNTIKSWKLGFDT